MGRLLLTPLLVTFAIIYAGTVGWGELRYLLPFWGPGPLPLLWRSAGIVGLFGPSALFVLAAMGKLRSRRESWKAAVGGLVLPGLVLSVGKAILLMTYPMPMGLGITFPLHEMSRLVLGGRFFERIDPLWLSIWVIATSLHLGALLCAAATSCASAFGLPSHRTVVLPLTMLTATLALFPKDQGAALVYHEAMAPYSLAIGFGLPLVLAAAVSVRKGRAMHGG